MAHLSVVSLTQVVLLLVFICWTPSSTGAAFSLEEEFLQLKENYIQMKQIVKSLEAKVEQLKSLESTAIELQAKVTVLEAKVEQQDSLFKNCFSREKNERTAAAAANSVPISNNPSAVTINGLPSSCGDLKMIGHTLNGFYSIMGSAKMESVYCDFTKLPDDAGFQKWIGYADVKSAPVHFYVQINSPFTSGGTPIPFDLAVVNEGNAMNLTSGVFTAPRPGIYFFSFAGVAYLRDSAFVGFWSNLYLNGNRIGTSYVGENYGPVEQWSPLSLQSTLNLKKGDQLWVTIGYYGSSSSLSDYSATGDHRTHFTGFMLEEEIVASL